MRILRAIFPAAASVVLAAGAWRAIDTAALVFPSLENLSYSLALLLIGAAWLKSAELTLAGHRRTHIVDIGLAVIVVSALISAAFSAPLSLSPILGVPVVSFGFCAARLACLADRRKPATRNAVSIDELISPTRFGPRKSDRHSILDRRYFVDMLHQCVKQRAEAAVCLGLCGPWGSGKTTILDDLSDRLRSEGATVVRFDAWAYRKPENIISALLAQLQIAANEVDTGELADDLETVFEALLPGHSSLIQRLARSMRASTSDDARARLRARLGELDSPITVVIDDLDRLDADEVRAVVRAVRLLADLPNLAYVLAYDREHLSRLLCKDLPPDAVRDYIAKLIGIELTIPSLRGEGALRVFDDAFRPLTGQLTESARDEFQTLLRYASQEAVISAVGTPREIYRLSAQVGLTWQRLSDCLNFTDLFLLYLIRNRFPDVYGTITNNPEWFAQMDWSDDVAASHKSTEWTGKGVAYREKLSETNPHAAELLKVLIGAKSSLKDLAAWEQRRFWHPQVIRAYLELTRNSETGRHDLAAAIIGLMKSVQPGFSRAQAISDVLRRANKDGKIDLLFTRWDLVSTGLANLDIRGIQDLTLGISIASNELPAGRALSANNRASQIVMRLIAQLPDDDSATKALEEVFLKTRSLEFLGNIIFYVRTDGRRQKVFDERKPALPALQARFDQVVREQFPEGSTRLLEATEDAQVAVIFHCSDQKHVAFIIDREIAYTPSKLPTLISHFVILEERGSEIVIKKQWFDEMKRLPIEGILASTKDLPLNQWGSRLDQERVRAFREHFGKPRQIPTIE